MAEKEEKVEFEGQVLESFRSGKRSPTHQGGCGASASASIPATA
jgi:hypothetical protein